MALVNKIVEELSARLTPRLNSALTDILTSPEFISEVEAAKAQAELSSVDSVLVAASKEAGAKGKKGRPKGSKNKPKVATTETPVTSTTPTIDPQAAKEFEETLAAKVAEEEELYIAAD